MELTDTHCHIQFADYGLDPDETVRSAQADGVTRLLVIGCRLEDSHAAVRFAAKHESVWASIGLHPHEAGVYVDAHTVLQEFRSLADKPKVIAIGETGLDFYYNHSTKEDQEKLLRFQLDVAVEHDLPLIFHVRDAFDDFWRIIDDYATMKHKLRGVIHSFSAGPKELSGILEHGFYVGLNGIMTFTAKPEQLDAAKMVPLDRLLLETDAPFLTPTPYRGTINEPKHVRVTAEFLAKLRGERLETLAMSTTRNALNLFKLL